MREIIFRGKDSIGEWRYGNLITKRVTRDETDITVCSIHGITNDNFCSGINPESVGQYTGLTDKNGKKIFEGDILKHIHTKDWGGEVYFKEGVFKITPNGAEYTLNEVRAKQSYVAGNIHDNPSLLK